MRNIHFINGSKGMRRYAAICIMFLLLAAILVATSTIGGCSRKTLEEWGLMESPEDDLESEDPDEEDPFAELDSNSVSNPVAPPAWARPEINPSPIIQPPEPNPLPEVPAEIRPHASSFDFIPDDSLCVTSFSPRRTLMESPAVGRLPLREILVELGRSGFGIDVSSPGRFLDISNTSLRDLEEVILIIDGVRPEGVQLVVDSLAGKEPELTSRERSARAIRENRPNDPAIYGSIVDGYVMRFHGAAPQEAIQRMLFYVKPVSLNGIPYYGHGWDTHWGAIYFPDPYTIVLGEEVLVRKMIQTQQARTAPVDPTQYMDPNYDITLTINWRSLYQRLDFDQRMLLREIMLSDAVEQGQFRVRLSERPSLRLQIDSISSRNAAGLESIIRNRMTTYGEGVATTEPWPEPWESLRADIWGRLNGDLSIEQRGPTLELGLIDSFDLVDALAASRRWVALASGQTPPDEIEAVTQPPISPTPTAPIDSLHDPAIVRQLILRQAPPATGIRFSEYLAFIQSSTAFQPSQFTEQSLSVALLCAWKYADDLEAVYTDRLDEFRYTCLGNPSATEILEVMGASGSMGYCSFVQYDNITNITCDITGDVATGVISFHVPRLYQGDILYKAELREGTSWEIVEISLPYHQWTFQRDEEGRWRWTDAFGDAASPNRCPPKHRVTGDVKLNGRLLTSGRLEFFHEAYPEWPFDPYVLFAPISSYGTYRINLPPGNYSVRVRDSLDGVPSRYSRLDSARLRVTIPESGTTTVYDFEL